MSAKHKLEALQTRINAIEGHGLDTSAGRRVLPFADQHLNNPLPGGGLQLGALHEFVTDGLENELAPGVTAFAATVTANILREQNSAGRIEGYGIDR
jgi:protein ImuA